MTGRTYMVPVRTNPHTGKTEHAFVWADSPEQARAAALAKAGTVIGAAQLAIPWLDVDKVLPGDSNTLPPLTDGQTRESDGTVSAQHPRTREVMDWLRTYEGRNTFVQDVKFKVENGRQYNGRNAGSRKGYRVTGRQVEALAKVKDAETKRHEPGPGVSGLNLWAVLPYGTTRAAAKNERGTLSFVRMDKVKDGRWADFVFVKAIIGGSEDMRLGMQGPDRDEYSGQWPEVLRNVAADVDAAVRTYGLELGVCGACNSPLTNEESRRLGIGPVCRSKLTA
jgi:hypothetical protein